MKYSILMAWIALSMIASAQAPKPTDWERYQTLNNKETRLSEFKDDDRMLTLKLNQLEVINQSRKKYKAKAVELDIFASRVANKMATEAAENGFMGHYNMLGQTPYMRYGLAGGHDHVTENASAYSSTEATTGSDEEISRLAKQIHQAFMAEKSPNDGHKQTCINEYHNYVGLGIASHKGEFRYYEEFIDKYIEFGDIPSSVKPGTTVDIDVTGMATGYKLYALMVYMEGKPRTLQPKTISSITSYPDFTKTVVANLAPWDFAQPNEKGVIKVPVTLAKKGYYYLQFYIDDKPYKKGKASTEGKVCASGIVIVAE